MTSVCNQLFGLHDRVVVVTGGCGDLGRAIAELLVKLGAKVAVIGRRVDSDSFGSDIWALGADVRSKTEMENAFDTIAKRFGGVTCLVNNAGVYLDNRVTDGNFLDDWTALIDVNLTGSAICSAAAAPYFQSQGYGKIVNIGSAYSRYGHQKSAGYTAAKTGVVGLTRALAAELGREGIRANAVLPGWFDTKMNKGVPGTKRGDYITDATPLGRWGTGGDLAGVIGFLCGPASDFLSGAIISVDGGYCISDRCYSDN